MKNLVNYLDEYLDEDSIYETVNIRKKQDSNTMLKTGRKASIKEECQTKKQYTCKCKHKYN